MVVKTSSDEILMSDSDELFYITQSSPKRLVENVQEQPSESHESRLIFIPFMFVITLIHIVKHSSILYSEKISRSNNVVRMRRI